MPFSLDDFNTTISRAAHPEKLRDILVLIFHEVVMRGNGNRNEQTGFEAATDEELELAFLRTVNELLVRWGRLQDQLGNYVVSVCDPEAPFYLMFHRIFNTSFKMAGSGGLPILYYTVCTCCCSFCAP
jgi:hypothetical protein